MKKEKRFIFFLLICCILLYLPPRAISAATGKKAGYVNYTYLNLRKESTTSSDLVVKLSEYDHVIVRKNLDDWYKVYAYHEGKKYNGYVAKRYINTYELRVDGYVNNTSLNLRQKAATSSDVIIKLKKHDLVKIHKTTGDWYQVTAYHLGKAYKGYVKSSYIKLYSTSTATETSPLPEVSRPVADGYVNNSYLNLRKEPSTSADIIIKLAENDPVYIKKTLTDWYQVSADHAGKSYEGYVSKKYITLYENTESTITKLKAVSMNSVYLSDQGSARITWSKLTGADGYYIYRKTSDSDYKRIAAVSADTNAYSEKDLLKNTKYTYKVTAYETIDGKKYEGKSSSGMAPTLPYSGTYLFNTTKTYIGNSGGGRQIFSYKIGNGKRHLFMTAAIHGFEDNFDRDGLLLVKAAENLLTVLSKETATLANEGFSVYIIPMANPDGIYDGSSNNGPGRCTTYRYNEDGILVKGGVDINRSFPAGFKPDYSGRNYTGSKSLMCKESKLYKKLIDEFKGSSDNIFIDVHGWYNQTITQTKGSGKLYNAFKKEFPNTRPSGLSSGNGYISRYALSIGYDSVLFEFPSVNSSGDFSNKGYNQSFQKAVIGLIKSY